MGQYRIRPGVVEAMQFDGTRKCGKAIREKWYQVGFGMREGTHGFEWDGTLRVATAGNGYTPVVKGDWIVRGGNGEFTVCCEREFHRLYEEIAE